MCKPRTEGVLLEGPFMTYMQVRNLHVSLRIHFEKWNTYPDLQNNLNRFRFLGIMYFVNFSFFQEIFENWKPLFSTIENWILDFTNILD